MSSMLLNRFLSYCTVPAPSLSEGPMAERVRHELEALGLSWQEDGAAAAIGGEAGNHFTSLEPAGPADRWIVLAAHLDAVPPGHGTDPAVDGDIVRSREGILAGDDRAGVAIILQILEDLGREPLKRTGVQAVFSVCEESGIKGVKAMDRSRLLGESVIVIDTAGSPGQMNVRSPEAKKFTCTFRGKSAHAGVSPEAGVNALLMATRVAESLPSGRIDGDTTFSFTVLRAGDATNVVPDKAVLRGETRSFIEGETQRLMANLEEICAEAAAAAGGGAQVGWEEQFPGFSLDPDAPLVRDLARAAERCGFAPEPRKSGGGSDANVYNAMGIPAVNIAAGYRNGHSPEEHLVVSDFEGVYRWVSEYLRMVDGG